MPSKTKHPLEKPAGVNQSLVDQQPVVKDRRTVQWELKWLPRREVIEDLYLRRNWLVKQIAEHFGETAVSTGNAMRRLGFKTPGRVRHGAANGRYVHGKAARPYRKLVNKVACARCGGTKQLSVHHKNDDHYDNRKDNLEVVCNSCHMRETKQKWWAAKKAGVPLPKSTGRVGWVKPAIKRVRTGQRAKVNATQVVNIRKRHATGDSLTVLSREYGVSVSNIHAIVTRRSWKTLEAGQHV